MPMQMRYSKNSVEISRALSGLDKFVIDFVKLLDSLKIRYIIVSGYVAILFGRSRGTEDIDIFIEGMNSNKFFELARKLGQQRLWVVNTASSKLAYKMLKDGDAIRVAERNRAIPNIEMKIAETAEDKKLLENPLVAVVNNIKLCISPIENQIAFKLYLGSGKDIEDALYLYELFKGKLDKKLLAIKCKELNVLEAMRKYVK